MAWIDEQLVARGIRDPRVLDAMRRVPRQLFVPEVSQPLAYADRALPIGGGQTISQPYMVAAMTEALLLEGGERVLEIGTGSGYQAAILAELAAEVVSVERRPELADAARSTLPLLGYHNVEIVVGDGTLGLADRAPFDRIVLTAGAPRVPEALTRQLSGQRGRLVIPRIACSAVADDRRSRGRAPDRNDARGVRLRSTSGARCLARIGP